MAYEKGKHPGTTWHKCDFQCHSPRDRAWDGPTKLPGGEEKLENARHSWALAFLEACNTAKLSAVAITDHHDICLAAYVEEIAGTLGYDVKVFSGVEITCADNVQCLAIFDPSLERDTQKSIFALAGNVYPAHVNDQHTCAIQPANKPILQLFDAVAQDQRLRDGSVLIPHFSAEAAHKSLNEPGHHPRFVGLSCDGIYIERPYDELDAGTLDKIRGKVPEWGSRRRAILATGDNKSETWTRLGAHNCWIKLGEHSVEAIRQAFLADEARISFAQPEMPSELIRAITVRSDLTGGTPITITFNDGFNALIGGRGSGKTAILEYLRFGLGRATIDLEPDRADKKQKDRETELIEETLLQGGFVEVTLDREGVSETWRREYPTRATIICTGQDGQRTELSSREARIRFRGRAFSQKGLSTTMMDMEKAAEDITSIAAAEELDQRRQVDQDIANAKRTVTTSLQQLAAYWQTCKEQEQAAQRITDLRARIQAIADRLAAEGVSEAHLRTIEDQPRHARAGSYIEQVTAASKRDRGTVTQLAEAILNVDLTKFEGVEGFDEIKNLADVTAEASTEIKVHLNAILAELTTVDMAASTCTAAFKVTKEKFNERYKEAVAQQAAHKNLIGDNERLSAELQGSERTYTGIAAKEAETKQSVASFDAARKSLADLLTARRTILKSAADKVSGRSSNLLTARVKRDPMPSECVQALSGLFQASGVQDVNAMCEELIKEAVKVGATTPWPAICDTLLGVFEAKLRAGSPPEPDAHTVAALRTLFRRVSTDRQASRVYQNINDASIGALLSATPRDFIVFTYVDEGRDIDFRKASPGQQASALLELLLHQSAGTLIIDQPEDDLDNRVIMKIVELIRASKSRRQLIFSTHNPNVVVNGDADKIIALTSAEPAANPRPDDPRIQIETDGAIETPNVRSAITKIMEGGEKAFDLRRRKYRFSAAA